MAFAHIVRPLGSLRRCHCLAVECLAASRSQINSFLRDKLGARPSLLTAVSLFGVAGFAQYGFWDRSILLAEGPANVGNDDDDDDDDLDAQARRWGGCAPLELRSGPRVFVWGHRACWPACEATGDRPPESDLRTPTEVVWFRNHAERHGCTWQQLDFGPSFGVSRTSSGELFVWGSSLKKDGKGRQYVSPRPLIFKDASETTFQDVQCSESAVWALTSEGQVVVWELVPTLISEQTTSGSSSFICGGKRLGGLSKAIRQMSVGVSHAAFLTEAGEVYCLGRNSCGECGADPSVHGMATACRKVKFPRHCTPIARVECGKSHTVAVGAEGQVLAWGDDSKIQLGLGDTRSNVGEERHVTGSRGFLNERAGGERMALSPALRGGPDGQSMGPSTSQKKYAEFESHHQYRPTVVMDIPLEYERQVHGIPYPPPNDLQCGDDFTLLAVRDSPDWFAPEETSYRIFCCGENGRGQCGRSMQQQQQVFAACKLPRNSQNLGFSCGSNHCLAGVRRVGLRKHELWCWGSNGHGQIGGNTSGVVCPASRLRLPKGMRVEAAWCGFSSSAVISSELKRPGNPASPLEEEDPA
eukprot:TRINITY_DN34376_c0_g1_i1.p1 TRINITY_DN34376_c0_g1~~TRINITY_DN34376_c0_g1_i1.p1  ORF type:complete len:584 (-),score=74.68 TRINITY_DN34376_c0_g1_i1:34-1785(-)